MLLIKQTLVIKGSMKKCRAAKECVMTQMAKYQQYSYSADMKPMIKCQSYPLKIGVPKRSTTLTRAI